MQMLEIAAHCQIGTGFHLAGEEEEEELYKFLPANTADRLCQSWQSCFNHHVI